MLRADTRLGRLIKALAATSSPSFSRPSNRIVAALATVRLPAPTEPARTNRLSNFSPRRRDGVRGLLAALAVAVVVIMTAVFYADVFRTQVPGTPRAVPGTPIVEPRTLPMYDGELLAPWSGYVSENGDWDGTEFVSGAASLGSISVAPDGQSGMRVTWHGSAAQVYLQRIAGAVDLSSYVDSGGALVFDTVVHTPPAASTRVGVHCVYPCVADVEAASLFRDLPVGRKTTVKIPLSCFVDEGLDARMVNTPFLVHTAGAFDATFFNIRWEPGAATDDDATPCQDLH